MDSGKHVYHIGGIEIEFPHQAYGPQLAYMGKVVATLGRAFRDHESRCNALLESPTGSGKTLSLLCAAIAWQQHRKRILELGPPTQLGGGFIPEETTAEDEETKKKLLKPPTIFFATRTHSQISQIVREFRKTTYRVPMAVLAARKHYCTNQQVRKKGNIDEECNILLKNPGKTCPLFKNARKFRGYPSLRKGGCHEIHDIEDLVGVAQVVKGCAYFASRDMAATASIVFCPYSYIINPLIRKAMGVDIRGAILIFDEAHNIEDICRGAGSYDLDAVDLQGLRGELEQLCSEEALSELYQPILEVAEEMLMWIHHQEACLKELESERHWASWTGPSAIQQLQSAGISLESFQVLFECVMKATGAASDPDPEKSHLSGKAATVLEGLFTALRFMLSKPGFASDYQVVLQKTSTKISMNNVQEWTTSLHFWCLNPGIVFNEIAAASKSVILTSGTLSPMSSFASELGVPFDVSMEAVHVIDMNTQVCVSTVPLGPGGVSLNASYKFANTYTFQDALGLALEEIFSVVPDGTLVFFPSYSLLERVCSRWRTTGQWNRLVNIKELFAEPRAKTEDFEEVLSGYYKSIKGFCQPRPITTKKPRKSAPQSRRNGAAFLAVCRGKVSEGINFADENARVVIVVGIPFPNVKDIQVSLKKKYNDSGGGKLLLKGDQWYCHQAFRALNQAVGRCIRHRNDYGAILLLDERFCNPKYVTCMSKWLRNAIKQFGSFPEVLTELRNFFQRLEAMSPTTRTSSPGHRSSTYSSGLRSSTGLRSSAHQPCLQTFLKEETKANSSSVQPLQEQGLFSFAVIPDANGTPLKAQKHREAAEDAPEASEYWLHKQPANASDQVVQPPIDACCQSKIQQPTDQHEKQHATGADEYLLSCIRCGHHLCASPVDSRGVDHRKTYLQALLDIAVDCQATCNSPLAVIVIDPGLLEPSLTGNNSSSSLWIGEDGSVLKPVFCSWCVEPNVCLGASVVTSTSLDLCGKVVLLTESVKATAHGTSVSDSNEKRASAAPAAKGKLKLRRINV